MQRLDLTLLIQFCFGLVTNEETKDIDELLTIKENEENKQPFDGKKPSEFAKKEINNIFDKNLCNDMEYKGLINNFELIYTDKYKKFLFFLEDAAFYFLRHKQIYSTLKMTDESMVYFCYCCEFSFYYIFRVYPEICQKKISKKNKNEYYDIRVLFFVECIQLMNWIHKNKDKLLKNKYFTKKPCRMSNDWLGDLNLRKAVPFAALSIHPSIEKNYAEQKIIIRCSKFE